MLEEWSVTRFKSIYSSTPLALAPLTVFAGANSSGKSALLQSILLLAQSMSHRVTGRTIVLNGHLCRLGTFNDIFPSGVTEHGDISIGFRYRAEAMEEPLTYPPRDAFYWSPGQQPTSVSCDVHFSAGGRSADDAFRFFPVSNAAW